MALKLNLLNEISFDSCGNKIKKYEEFCGKNIEQMPELKEAGRYAFNTAEVMKRRLDLRTNPFEKQIKFSKSNLALFIEQNQEQFYSSQKEALTDWNMVKTAWIDNCFDTGDGRVYHPKGDVLIDLDSQYLRNMNPKSSRSNGALLLSENRDEAFAIYEQLRKQSHVIEFKKEEMGNIRDGLSQNEALNSKWWRVLNRHPEEVPKEIAIPDLHEEVVHYIFSEYQERFAKNTSLDDLRLMGIFPGSANGNTPKMRGWFVIGLYCGSDVYGGVNLDGDIGRFVGKKY